MSDAGGAVAPQADTADAGSARRSMVITFLKESGTFPYPRGIAGTIGAIDVDDLQRHAQADVRWFLIALIVSAGALIGVAAFIMLAALLQ